MTLTLRFITFWGDGIKYDQMDCSFFLDWDSVLKELYSAYVSQVFTCS